MSRTKYASYNFYFIILITFIVFQLLLITFLYESYTDVSEIPEQIDKKLKIFFLNTSLSDDDYIKLFQDFCHKESNKTLFIRNPRLLNDNVGIFIPVFNQSTSHLLISTLFKLLSASERLKLKNSVTLTFDASKENCRISTQISNLFMFDIKIGFLRLLRLPILYKDLSKVIADKNLYENTEKIDLQNNLGLSIQKLYNTTKKLNVLIDGANDGYMNIYFMNIISNLFDDSFNYYLHLSVSNRMPEDYLSVITTFLLKTEISSRQSFCMIEFGSQEFPSGLAIRAREVGRFSQLVLKTSSRVRSTSIQYIYLMYLKIVSQMQRIIYLPPVFHSTNPNFEFLPDPNPLAYVYTNIQTLNDMNLILTEGGSMVNGLKSGDQIVILFADGVVLNAIHWSVDILRNYSSQSSTSTTTYKTYTNSSSTPKFELFDELQAYIEASPVLMGIDKKRGLAKCADYQLLTSFHKNRLVVANVSRIIGRITTRCLKLTIVKDSINVIKFDRILISVSNF